MQTWDFNLHYEGFCCLPDFSVALGSAVLRDAVRLGGDLKQDGAACWDSWPSEEQPKSSSL